MRGAKGEYRWNHDNVLKMPSDIETVNGGHERAGEKVRERELITLQFSFKNRKTTKQEGHLILKSLVVTFCNTFYSNYISKNFLNQQNKFPFKSHNFKRTF